MTSAWPAARAAAGSVCRAEAAPVARANSAIFWAETVCTGPGG